MFVSVCLYSREYERHQSYLIYVYHGAAITCKINEEEMSEKGKETLRLQSFNAQCVHTLIEVYAGQDDKEFWQF